MFVAYGVSSSKVGRFHHTYTAPDRASCTAVMPTARRSSRCCHVHTAARTAPTGTYLTPNHASAVSVTARATPEEIGREFPGLFPRDVRSWQTRSRASATHRAAGPSG